MINFRQFFESIDFNSQEVIVPQGEVLYHGTLESFDTRKIRTGGYDDVFWTSDEPIIARMYIPFSGSYSNMSVDHILRDKDCEGIRKSLGLSNNIVRVAWQKHNIGYEKLKYWRNKHEEFQKQFQDYKKAGNYAMDDDFFKQWIEAEDNYKKAQQEWRGHDSYLKSFVVKKMKIWGYEPSGYSNDSFKRILTDREGNLLPANNKSVGKVLKVICNRNFKFYNMAYQKEGDLTDVDYHKIDMFRKIEKSGYDGVIINDYAQSDYHGNYGHLSIGFFKGSLKDLTIKQIKNQTHPGKEEFE